MVLTDEQARRLDRRAIEEIGIPGLVLMENAGRAMAELLISLHQGGPVAVCCGPGNNGGDGFVIARYLDNAAIPTRVLFFGQGDRLRGDAATSYQIACRCRLSITELPPSSFRAEELRPLLDGAAWIVDALFGSGLAGPLRPPFDLVVQAVNASGARVFAVDVPSGLDGDTGQPRGVTVRASHTAVVAAPRAGFSKPEAVAWTGQVHTIDLGIPRWLLSEVAGPGGS